MKYYSLLVLFLFTSCPKEIIVPQVNLENPSFFCIIDGNDFSNSNPIISINNSDMMSISVEDDTYNIDFRIYNFSLISEDSNIFFSVPAMGLVTLGGVTYSNLYNGPPFDGFINFSVINENKLSGTFSFKSQDVNPISFLNINVNGGEFHNISYSY